MNGYKAFYRGKECEVNATSAFDAQLKASDKFNAKRTHEVTVVLCEKDGEQVVHTPSF